MKHTSAYESANLNALADGELESRETSELLERIKHSPEMQRELCDVHLLKDMLRSAYPAGVPAQPARQRQRHILSIAASLLMLAVGFIVGSQQQTPVTVLETVSLQGSVSQPHRVVLHIDESSSEKFENVLQHAESMLVNYHEQGVQVDIVTSASGVELLMANAAPHLSRVSSLARSYETLTLVACNNTLTRMRKEGRQTKLINEAIIASSAVEHVVKRLQQGWQYVAI